MNREVDLLCFPAVERKLGTRTEEHRRVARRFGEEFFDGERDYGYGGYRDDGRWRAVAARMVLYYGLKQGARILDIGCAKGFLVRDFVALGMDAYGIDVSEYAISKSVIPERTFVADARAIGDFANHRTRRKEFDLIVSINTLHNLEARELSQVLATVDELSICSYVTVDAWHTPEERERMLAWNLTAKTMMSARDWLAFFRAANFHGDVWWFIP